jgi:hypothetical protein
MRASIVCFANRTPCRRRLVEWLVVLLCAGCIVLMAGCQSIGVPVAVSCVDEGPVRPQFYSDGEIKTMDDYKAVQALRVDRAQAEKYIGELEDVVEVCKHAPRVVSVPAAG